MIFGAFDISNMLISILMSELIFIKYLPPVKLKLVPKLKITQNLLKFGTLDISNMSILILISKMIFVKYLPPAMPKLVPKLKVGRFY